MSFPLVDNMLKAYEEMANACNTLSDAIRSTSELPMVLPTYEGEPGGERDAVIKSLTQIWNLEAGEQIIEAGLICAPDNVIQCVHQLNIAKAAFKETVIAIRHSDGAAANNNNLTLVVDRHVTRGIKKSSIGRGEELKVAMNSAQINRLDLIRCYRQIRVLPDDLESISWTWARTHTASEPISLDEAVKLAEQLSKPETQKIALDLLGKLPPGVKLTLRKRLPNQLRANIVYLEDGDRKRKPVTISGIVISSNKTVPKYVWRPDPGPRDDSDTSDRLTRMDSRINPEPYVSALNIHLYSVNEGSL